MQQKQNAKMWNYHQEHCVEFLRDTLELSDRFSSEDIIESINIMYINSVNMELGPESTHAPVTGFYPLFANINHDCSCNTKTVKHPDNRLEVRCIRAIRKGEEITTQYVSPDKNTKLRRRMLFKKWFFWCECHRCKDKTEIGSFLGAFICQESKCGGSSVPYNPLDEESDYICLDCGNSFSNKYAEKLLKNAEKDLKTPDSRFDLIQHLEKFIHNNSRILHPYNNLMISVKQKLGSIWQLCSL